MAAQKITAGTDLVIDRQEIPQGTLIGEIHDDGTIVSKLKGVDLGHIEARLGRRGMLIVGNQSSKPPAKISASDAEDDLMKMSKGDLLEFAKDNGIEVDASWTKAELASFIASEINAD